MKMKFNSANPIIKSIPINRKILLQNVRRYFFIRSNPSYESGVFAVILLYGKEKIAFGFYVKISSVRVTSFKSQSLDVSLAHMKHLAI